MPTMSTFITGKTSATSGGSAVQLNAGYPCKVVSVKANPDNSGIIYLTWHAKGSPAVDADWYPLSAGDPLTIEIDNLSKIYFDVQNTGDFLHWAILR